MQILFIHKSKMCTRKYVKINLWFFWRIVTPYTDITYQIQKSVWKVSTRFLRYINYVLPPTLVGTLRGSLVVRRCFDQFCRIMARDSNMTIIWLAFTNHLLFDPSQFILPPYIVKNKVENRLLIVWVDVRWS